MKMRSKLIIMFLVTGIVPLVIIGWWSVNLSVSSLMKKSYDQLESIREIKKNQIMEYFNEKKADTNVLVETAEVFRESAFERLSTAQENKKDQVEAYFKKVRSDILKLSKSRDVLLLFSQLKKYHDDLQTAPEKPFDISAEIYHSIYNQHSRFFSNFVKTHGYYDMFLICAEHGHVMFTVNRGKEMGTNLAYGPYKNESVAHIWKQVIGNEDIVVEDFSAYAPDNGRQAGFIGAPVYDDLNHLTGLIAFKIQTEPINAIVQGRRGLRKTGETYIAGKKADIIGYRSDRIVEQARVGEKISLPYVEKALAGESGGIVTEGSTGDLQVVVYSPVHIPGLRWAVITTESLKENLAPKYKGEQDYYSHYINSYAYYDLFLIHPQGKIFYSVKHESDYGTDIINGKYKDSGLGKLVRKVLKTRMFSMADFEPYAPSNNEPAAFIAEPVIHNDKVQLIVALQLSIKDINNIMQERDGMGETGETYLIGADRKMRSDSYLDPEKHSIKASFAGTLKDNGVDTEAAAAALEGKTGAKIITDYNDKTVLSAYTPLKIHNVKWALVAEINKDEVSKPINRLILSVFIACLTVIVIGAVITFIITRGITRPIGQAVEFASSIARGDMSRRLDIKTRDEIGNLTEALNQSADDLATMLVRIRENSENLAGASDGLSSVSAQLASSSEETSAGISTMASAAEEMSVNAHSVSSTAEQMSAIMNSIASAVEEMTVSVSNITQNAKQGSDISRKAIEISDAATKTINALGQAAAEIGEVTEVIRQIAQQTNLLALNATIEAASAGDAGKGFAVVANEIKDLASQSGRSAEDIAKRIRGVQASSEETIRAIGDVSGIISQISESSAVITHSVEQQSAASNEISSSIQQANEGVGNIAVSIAEIAKGSNDMAENASMAAKGVNEISASAQQVRTSSEELAKVAAQLNEMVGRFKVEGARINN